MISSNSSAKEFDEAVAETGPMRPQVASDPAPRPTRRSFTAAYKLAVVGEYEAAPHGEKSAVLRRGGLHHCHIKEWTRARDVGARSGLTGARTSKPGSKASAKDRGEVERLRAQNVRLTAQLAQTRTALDIIGQVWFRELDEGRYWCSLSSMYRIARAAGQSRERRALATHPAKVKPELLADAPSQVWSWDITKLRGPTKGVWFHLYVLIDIYSRYNPGWIVAAREDSVLAKDFLDEAITRNGTVPHTVHADRGTSMTSKPVCALLVDLGVTRSHSWPRVSNDDPFSEAQFKTMKYLHDFPGSFTSVQDARQFCDGFFAEYNHVFRHSGIGWHTPASVHFGTAGAVDDARQITLNAAYAAHPERFGRRPTTPKIPQQSWINQPQPELQHT